MNVLNNPDAFAQTLYELNECDKNATLKAIFQAAKEYPKIPHSYWVKVFYEVNNLPA